jgi:hypothetical protein
MSRVLDRRKKLSFAVQSDDLAVQRGFRDRRLGRFEPWFGVFGMREKHARVERRSDRRFGEVVFLGWE